MKRLRRVPRKVGQEDDEGADSSSSGGNTDQAVQESVVKRPVVTSRGSSRIKKPSTLRASFTPSAQDDEDDENGDGSGTPVPPGKKLGLARQALERTAADRLPFRAGNSESTPSYNADYLAELRNSQPSTPRDLGTQQEDPFDQEASDAASSSTTALDIFSKFGTSDTALILPGDTPQPSLIPTNAEIQEKKERRRRLAAEEKAEDFISLSSGPGDDHRNFHAAASSDEDDGNDDARHLRRSLIIPAEKFDPHALKYPETRLVRDDEDMAEGFDDFVEDSGKVTLSRAGLRTQEAARRKAIQAQIRCAQGRGGDDDDDGSSSNENNDKEEEEEIDEDEAARLRAYEAAQTRAGTYGDRLGTTGLRTAEREKEANLHRRLARAANIKVTPVPDMKSVLARWNGLVLAKEGEVKEAMARLDAVRREREGVRADEARVVMLLAEAGERFEKLRGEVGVARLGNGNGNGESGGRGLESLGGLVGTPVSTTPVDSPGVFRGGEDDQDDTEGGDQAADDEEIHMHTHLEDDDTDTHTAQPWTTNGRHGGLGFGALGPGGLGGGGSSGSGMAGMAGRPSDGYGSDDDDY